MKWRAESPRCASAAGRNSAAARLGRDEDNARAQSPRSPLASSVADELVRTLSMPVLLVRPKEELSPGLGAGSGSEAHLDRATDGSPEAEQVLPSRPSRSASAG